MIEPPCSGFVILDLERGETVLVCTDSDNYSFPKGKRHKGEKSFDVALRETEEETGLKGGYDFDIIDRLYFDEQSNRGNIATRYYVGILKDGKRDLSFDPKELKTVCWIKYEDVFELEKFKDRRKAILKDVIDRIQ